MFGKTRDVHDTDTLDTSALDEFFGDEAAAENSVEIHDLRDRVDQAESQIASQFTSLATYAQIAQEQVEMARAEAKSATERSEQRLTSLIERERTDRITSFTGETPAGSAPEVTARLDALEHAVAQIRKGLDECMSRQKALADAITAMFERRGDTEPLSDPTEGNGFVPTPTVELSRPPLVPPTSEPAVASPLGGPIADLSLED